ncbi:alpha-2,8-sialyltransferase 8F-like isoform X2 [Anneissia japonica]|nr:alpha-2,8-sialyltransferase 8F-like isoform X2 [Anneissia japonica]
MVLRKSLRFTAGVYFLLLISCTLVLLGMIVNMHNRDCSEQVILKTYALIKSMSNNNAYDGQKLLSQLIQEDDILFQKNRNVLRDLPLFADKTISKEQIVRPGLLNKENNHNIEIRSSDDLQKLPPGKRDPPMNDETAKVIDGLQKLPPEKRDPPKNDETAKEIVPPELPQSKQDAPKKLDFSDGLRVFKGPTEAYHEREIKDIPPMEKVKENLHKSLNKHINTKELTRIRNNLITSGLTFERTVTTKVEDENEKDSEIRRQKFLSKLKAPYESCAVVGNGGVLEESYCGAEIDAHDFVMRSNMAPIVGFEEDVGKKVNFMTLNGEGTKVLIKCVKTFNNTCKRVYQSMKTIDESIIWFSKYGTLALKFMNLINQHLNSTVTHPSEPLSEELMKFWDITEHPSSGLFLYSIAVPICKTISLYGFYPYSKLPSGKRMKYHYYENFYIEDFVMGHDLPKEFRLLMKLNRAGALRLRAKPCF